jgi:hypothetical protein
MDLDRAVKRSPSVTWTPAAPFIVTPLVMQLLRGRHTEEISTTFDELRMVHGWRLARRALDGEATSEDFPPQRSARCIN